jgi:surface antigen
MKTFIKTILPTAIAVTMALSSTNAANALSTKSICQDGNDYSYHCVSFSGYKGVDEYGYHNHASHRPNGTFPHNCTAFAAYMLYLYNQFDQDISYLGNASEWDNNAYKVQGSVVSNTPHLGDIAVWDYYGDSTGHVAFVKELIKNSSGVTIGFISADDRYGLRKTTLTEIYKRDTVSGVLNEGWPDHFITFPKASSGGGSDTLVNMQRSPLG